MLDVISPGGASVPAPPLEPDDPDNALGRLVARLDVEDQFATVYLTFADGTYLTYAARIDEDGVILLDRFCDRPAAYTDYFVFDELEGETGPPPPGKAPQLGTPFDSAAWRAVVGLTLHNLGWDEEGMQAFIHFEEGGYLTFAARASEGAAYLLGYYAAQDPDGEEGYLEFEPIARDEDDV